ncbi:Hypothetical protein SRAE_2000199600 [Strongyloides ratti]|uniref:Uncharacterized protein n=1 Tax=Strongyloides ratti TaxID=34506 RepID=A0A090LC40_STRRB|nr:Hypothetical protein SRAE_2000199600 [Strongyloides ratti]CEF67332.1 Hypothetical protein SRAE_2000199600 [Strongyloides ratti]
MKLTIIFLIYIILLFCISNALANGNILEIACKRYPFMHMCSVANFESQRDESSSSNFNDKNNNDKKIVPINEERLITSREIDEEKETKNPFTDETSTFKDSSHSRDEVIEYCRNYNMNFATSCTKKINETDSEILNFCNSFISHCEGVDYEKKDTDKHSHRKVETDAEKDLNEFKHFTDEMHKKRKKKKLRPCTIDCDVKIYKHCTNECKCDYEYPSVQKFCNPPPMPLFLETCRLWYNRCPKFAQYHYSSQFIYSKASKGKTLPGSTHLASESSGFQGQT